MDKITAQVASLAILVVALIIIVFIQATGAGAEKSVLAGITGILGLVSGGGAGYVLGKAQKEEADETLE